MVRPPHSWASEPSFPPYRVEAPRASDAVGAALREAFEREIGLPDDMVAMLHRLNGRGLRVLG